jgi:Tol biopolymer transport system component
LTQEDLYVVALEGGAMRRVTSDTARDRGPRWMPDGRQILFYSDRSGRFDIWRIDADGGGLHQLTRSGVIWPAPSRDGTRVVASNPELRQMFIFDASDFSKPAETLPQFTESTVDYPVASDWSPDGRQIAVEGVGGRTGVWVYSLDTRTYRRFADGNTPAWLADGHRLVYDHRGRLWVLDTITGNTRELLGIPGEDVDYPLPIVGDSRLVFRRQAYSSDIWTVRFGGK